MPYDNVLYIKYPSNVKTLIHITKCEAGITKAVYNTCPYVLSAIFTISRKKLLKRNTQGIITILLGIK